MLGFRVEALEFEGYKGLGFRAKALGFRAWAAQSIQSCSKSIAIENFNRGLILLQNQSFWRESCVLENQSKNQSKQCKKINRKINREINREINRGTEFGCPKYVHICMYMYIYKASILGLSSPYMCEAAVQPTYV